MNKSNEIDRTDQQTEQRKDYTKPVLSKYGDITSTTHGSTTFNNDSQGPGDTGGKSGFGMGP